MTEKPGFLSYDRKTALSSDVIVIRRQVLIEGTVRFTFPRRDRTSVSGLIVDRAKVVTLCPSYDKTTLSIGLVPGFEPATYRSYATKLTPPADSAVVKYGFLSARCLLLTFGDHLWFMTEKLLIPFIFSLIRSSIFISMNVFLIALLIISGCVLQPSIFGGGGGGRGNLMTVQGDVSRKNSVTSRRTPLSERLKHAG